MRDIYVKCDGFRDAEKYHFDKFDTQDGYDWS